MKWSNTGKEQECHLGSFLSAFPEDRLLRSWQDEGAAAYVLLALCADSPTLRLLSNTTCVLDSLNCVLTHSWLPGSSRSNSSTTASWRRFQHVEDGIFSSSRQWLPGAGSNTLQMGFSAGAAAAAAASIYTDHSCVLCKRSTKADHDISSSSSSSICTHNYEHSLCFAGVHQVQWAGHDRQCQYPVRPARVPDQGVGPAQLAGCVCRSGAGPDPTPLPVPAGR